MFDLQPVSFSKKVKESVKGAVKFINAFEDTVAKAAARKDIDTVVCGHIHKPEIRQIQVDEKQVTYLNSGDWIENLTSLEYNQGEWKIFNYRTDFVEPLEAAEVDHEQMVDVETKELFNNILADFHT